MRARRRLYYADAEEPETKDYFVLRSDWVFFPTLTTFCKSIAMPTDNETLFSITNLSLYILYVSISK